MRYIKFEVYTSYVGTEDTIYEKFSDDTTDSFLEEYLDELIRNNAESYEYLATGWDEEFDDEEEKDNYYADCGGYWEEITKEKFDEEN